jgi:hypothetical protein
MGKKVRSLGIKRTPLSVHIQLHSFDFRLRSFMSASKLSSRESLLSLLVVKHRESGETLAFLRRIFSYGNLLFLFK